MRNRLTTALIDPLQIVILQTVEKGEMVDLVRRDRVDSVADETLLRSIRAGGIQQPLVLVSDGEKLMLADGLRRLRAAKALGIPKVPAAIDMLPMGRTPASYVQEIRFILDEHRQDLLPTQKGAFFLELKTQRGFTNEDLAKFLGCDKDSIYNFLAVLKYIRPVQLAMDAGKLSMRAARVFDGMTDDGQEKLWKAHRRELLTEKGRAEVHRKLRAEYSPQVHPELYRAPKLVKERMARGHKKRTSAASLEKRRLLATMAEKEAELAQAKADIARDEKEITAAVPIISAMLRTPKLRALIPTAMLPELERFSERYC